MRIASWRTAMPPASHFEGIRETATKAGSASGQLLRQLASAPIQCQRGGPVKTAADCLHCSRLVNFRPAPGGAVTIRCLWCDDDRVRDVMTLPTELVTIDPSTTIAEADDLARSRDLVHLLVVRDDTVLGVLSRADLLGQALPDETVANRIPTCPWTVAFGATLGEVVALMYEQGAPIVLVAHEGELAGVVTRGDLLRAGVPRELLGVDLCHTCGTTHGVIEHPSLPEVPICIDCAERALGPVDENELGDGD